MDPKPVILFDGVCNLCNGAVKFVIKRDKKSLIRFGSLQSEQGRRLLKQFNIPADQFHSFILLEKGRAYTQSTAALKVCKYLTGLWPMLYGFIFVPEIIRDGMYKWISKNRYNWFGKQEQCMIPTPEISGRFLQ